MATGYTPRLGLRPRYRFRLRSFEAICRMVGQGVGVGVVPRSATMRRGRAAGVKVMRLDNLWGTHSLVVCTKDIDVLPCSQGSFRPACWRAILHHDLMLGALNETSTGHTSDR